MSAKFIYSYSEWEQECNNRGYKISRCTCPDEDCLAVDRICKKTFAVDKEDKIVSIFKHFINTGIFYD